MKVFNVFKFFPSHSDHQLVEIFSSKESADNFINLRKAEKESWDQRTAPQYFIMERVVKD